MINTDDRKRMETLSVADLFEHHVDTLKITPSEFTSDHYVTWRQGGQLMLRIVHKDERGYYYFPDADRPFTDAYQGGEFTV